MATNDSNKRAKKRKPTEAHLSEEDMDAAPKKKPTLEQHSPPTIEEEVVTSEPISPDLDAFLSAQNLTPSVLTQLRQELLRALRAKWKNNYHLIECFQKTGILTSSLSNYFSLAELCSFIVAGLFEQPSGGILVNFYDRAQQRPKYVFISSWQELEKLLGLIAPHMNRNVLAESFNERFDGLLTVRPADNTSGNTSTKMRQDESTHNFKAKQYELNDPIMQQLTRHLVPYYATCDSLYDASWLRTLKTWQWWMWWSSTFPTEFVFLIARLLCQQDAMVMLGLLFEPQNWSVSKTTWATIECPFHIIIGKSGDPVWFPLYGLTYLDVNDHLPSLFQNQHVAKYDSSYMRLNTPVFVIQQGLNHGHVQIMKKLNENVTSCSAKLEDNLTQSLTQLHWECKTLAWSIPIPLFVLSLISQVGTDVMPLWQNILQSHLSRISKYKHVEHRMSQLSEVSGNWYRNLTGHQAVFQPFLGMGMPKMSEYIVTAYSLGINFSSGFVDAYDWLVSWFQFMQGQSQLNQSALLAIFKRSEPRAQNALLGLPEPDEHSRILQQFSNVTQLCKDLLFGENALLARVLLISMERHLVGKSFIEPVPSNYHWKVVLNNQELFLYTCESPWWEPSPPPFKTMSLLLQNDTHGKIKLDSSETSIEKTTIHKTKDQQSLRNSKLYSNRMPLNATLQIQVFNGRTRRPASTLTRYQAKDREVNETVYLTSDDFYALYPFEKKGITEYDENKGIDYSACESAVAKVNLTWLKSLLVAFFNNIPETVIKRRQVVHLKQALDENIIPLPRLLTKIYLDMMGYSPADMLEFTMMLSHPETVPPLMIQFLMELIYSSYLQSSNNNILSSLWSPYIPASSLVLDTVTYLQLGKNQNNELQSTDDCKHNNMLLVTASGQYIVVCLQRIYGITFDVEVTYLSSSWVGGHHVGQHLSHREFIPLLQNAVFLMQSYNLTW